MKTLRLLLLLIPLSVSVSGQRNSDYGVFAGVSSYFGDINTSRLLYSPLPAGGIFYRLNLNPREAIRVNIFLGGIRGSDLDFKNAYQQARAASFSGSVGEAAAQFEFNFLPYSTDGKKWDYTPYLAAGVGVAFVNSPGTTYTPVIPFSAGFKVNIYKNIGLEAEYGFRKTFYDNFDGLIDFIAPADHGKIHNNDWYTFTGVAITWKLYNKLAGCPAYGEVGNKRRK
jgi:hypothetical protein